MSGQKGGEEGGRRSRLALALAERILEEMWAALSAKERPLPLSPPRPPHPYQPPCLGSAASGAQLSALEIGSIPTLLDSPLVRYGPGRANLISRDCGLAFTRSMSLLPPSGYMCSFLACGDGDIDPPLCHARPFRSLHSVQLLGLFAPLLTLAPSPPLISPLDNSVDLPHTLATAILYQLLLHPHPQHPRIDTRPLAWMLAEFSHRTRWPLAEHHRSN
jgi:hypothetical protein